MDCRVGLLAGPDLRRLTTVDIYVTPVGLEGRASRTLGLEAGIRSRRFSIALSSAEAYQGLQITPQPYQLGSGLILDALPGGLPGVPFQAPGQKS